MVCRASILYGYKLPYSIKTNFKVWLKMILSLPVIPAHLVIDAWTIIKNKLPSDLNVQPIIDYFNSVWLRKFDVNLWNTFGSDGPRTNNFVESFNKLINKKLCSVHPTIWRFIDLIKELDSKMAIDLGRDPLNWSFMRHHRVKRIS